MRNSKWTAEEVGLMLCNPVYTGIGPFQQTMSDDQWISTQVTLIGREGVDSALRFLQRAIERTFPAADFGTDAESWIMKARARLESTGPERFFRELLEDLRASLKGYPAEATGAVFGYSAARSPENGGSA